MSGEKRCKNKSCNAPLLPGFEAEHGLCTRCMNAADKKDRMKAAANIVENVTGAKQAKPKTLSKSTSTGHKVDPRQQAASENTKPPEIDRSSEMQTRSKSTSIPPQVDLGRQGDNANTIVVSTKISQGTSRRFSARLKASGDTASQFLRAVIEDFIS